MQFKTTIFALALFCLSAASGQASILDEANWYQIARIANGDGGMFNGSGDLQSNYSFGVFTSSMQSTDFERPFSVYGGMEILFITGDGQVWGKTLYSDLRALIDARTGSMNPNITFTASINGVQQTTVGNVLSRLPSQFPEDPWVTLSGTHFDGIINGLILWGENNYAGPHTALEQAHQGVNVFVTVQAVPEPSTWAMMLLGFAGLAAVMAYRKRDGLLKAA